LHYYQIQNITYYKEKRISGAQNYIHAFKISDSLKELKIIEAKNDLLIQDLGSTEHPKWMNLSQDRSLQRQFPNSADHWDEFQDIMTLGVSPKELVENRFSKYGSIPFKIEAYSDNSIQTLLPFRTIQEFYQLDVVGTQRKIQELRSLEINNLHAQLEKIATQLKERLFENRNVSSLFSLKQLLIEITDPIALSPVEKERIKNIIYGQTLEIIGSYQVRIAFDFSSIRFQPSLSDLFYLSLMNGTSNPPQDIMPVIGMAKLLCWLQITISYFLLAFIVAALLKFLRIS
jgi:hypothetical protein